MYLKWSLLFVWGGPGLDVQGNVSQTAWRVLFELSEATLMPFIFQNVQQQKPSGRRKFNDVFQVCKVLPPSLIGCNFSEIKLHPWRWLDKCFLPPVHASDSIFVTSCREISNESAPDLCMFCKQPSRRLSPRMKFHHVHEPEINSQSKHKHHHAVVNHLITFQEYIKQGKHASASN